MSKTCVIIGTSAAAIGALNKLKQLDAHARIILISDEKEVPYNKCFLADYVAGSKTQEQVQTIKTSTSEERIQWLLATRVVKINSADRCIETDAGATIAYDTLLIATGSSPCIPPIQGIEGDGVFTFHTMYDAHAILAYIHAHASKRIVVIGAGLSGLEVADALSTRGLEITIIEKQDRVLSQVITAAASHSIQDHAHKQGVNIHLSGTVTSIMRTASGSVSAVQLSCGATYDADVVICATGLYPNSQLARDAGIALHEHSITVNEYLQTSIPDIYAAGDVVVVPDMMTKKLIRSTTWPDAMMQGMYAAQAMVGAPKAYPGIASSTSSSFFGLKWTCGGDLGPGFTGTIIERHTPLGYEYYRLIDGVLRGYVQMGPNLAGYPSARRALLTQDKSFLSE